MTGKTFALQIVTPRKVVFSGPVESFSAPGVMGGFQVLYNHAPMLAAIGIGEVRLRDANGEEKRYATSGGFVDVLRNQVTLLADTAEAPKEIDVPRAESARERASRRLSERGPDFDMERARVALMRAINRLNVAQKS